MKQYVIDQLRPDDYFKLKAYLDTNCQSSNIPGIYWLDLPQKLLEETQKSHIDCQPFCFAIELSQTGLSCELLVRTLAQIRCDCVNYASVSQRNWLIHAMDDICSQLEINI